LFAGRSTLDALYWLDQIPAEDTKAYARVFSAAPGGPALNAAVTHSLMGGEAMLVSAVGRGPWADLVRLELARRSIGLIDIAEGTSYETPLATVLIGKRNSSRTIVNPPLSDVALGSLTGSWQAVVPAEWDCVPPVVLCDGFYLDRIFPLLAACHKSGASLCLDGGSWKPGTGELAPLLTAAICSERFVVPGVEPGAEAVLDWFAALGVPSVAVTRGPRAILALDRGRRFQVDIAPIEAVDTLGAGDVLHGAFSNLFASEQNFEPALRRAAQIATLSCKNHGILC
jgi:sugar/nucleoside kinase (ribokinase family)